MNNSPYLIETHLTQDFCKRDDHLTLVGQLLNAFKTRDNTELSLHRKITSDQTQQEKIQYEPTPLDFGLPLAEFDDKTEFVIVIPSNY